MFSICIKKVGWLRIYLLDLFKGLKKINLFSYKLLILLSKIYIF